MHKLHTYKASQLLTQVNTTLVFQTHNSSYLLHKSTQSTNFNMHKASYLLTQINTKHKLKDTKSTLSF